MSPVRHGRSSARRSRPHQEVRDTEPRPGNLVPSSQVHRVGAVSGRPSRPPWPTAAVFPEIQQLPSVPPLVSSPSSYSPSPLLIPRLTRACRPPELHHSVEAERRHPCEDRSTSWPPLASPIRPLLSISSAVSISPRLPRPSLFPPVLCIELESQSPTILAA
jgi:hypothetical protein